MDSPGNTSTSGSLARVRPLVGATTVLLALRYLAWNARWQMALGRVGIRRCFGRGTVAILAAAAVNHLTPSFRVFGGLLRARYLSRSRSHPFPATYGAVLFDQIANQTVMGALSGTPGGSLTTEAAMVTYYGLLGVDRQAALAATLLYRGLHYLLILVFGVPSLGTLELLHRRSAPAADADEASAPRPTHSAW